MTNGELRQQVQSALDWEPSVDAGEIGVSVDDGVITLWGDVETYAEKSAAETAALGVYGVRAVANDITVRLRSDYERTDTEIARAAAASLKWSHIPTDRVGVTQVDDRITVTP